MGTQDQMNTPKDWPSKAPTGVDRLRFTRFTSEVNQRLGRRAGVAGAGLTAAAAGILWYLPATEWNFLSTWALLMLPWALACAALSWTRARIDITDDAFVVKASITTPPRTVPYDASCVIELSETDSADDKVSTWHVRLGRGEAREDLATLVEGQLQMRNVAEALCKLTGLPMLDASSDPVIRLEAADLDLPFRLRTQKYQQYDFREQGARTYGVHIDSPGPGLTRFSWHYLTRPAMRFVAIATVLLAVAFYVIDIEWGFPSHVYEWVGFGGILGTGGIAMLSLGFLETRLVMGPEEIRLCHVVGRLPAWHVTLPTGEVEDVRVIHHSVALISDRRILRFRTRRPGQAEDANARWLANEIRSYLLGRASSGNPALEAGPSAAPVAP